MSYQVLARKWRPRSFDEVAGQEHVLRALINALDNDRLHHAYLFTGTRGVGKTTLARILAKCLNCEKGVSAKACGECAACTGIDEGRFIDLIEVDAASRTKVEDTRELLDNVQYLPTAGRYKVYLIDEVHMLSTHSFNALLKTLEEPPPHVKFLLATTDPQKLPVTVLSRCLQFNLKNLSPERIVEYLNKVLGEENVPFEEAALWALARAADGSMRDALSLTDQAIAHGDGKITEAELSTMLGTIDRTTVLDMCRQISEQNAPAALDLVEALAEHAPDFSGALAEMLSIWHRVAVVQAVPGALDNSLGDQDAISELAAQVSREDVQLFYQICLLGRRDLSLAADPKSGLEMVLLRQLAFRPTLNEQIDPPEAVSSDLAPPEPVAVQGDTEAVKKPEPGRSPGELGESCEAVGIAVGIAGEYSSGEAGSPRIEPSLEPDGGQVVLSEPGVDQLNSTSTLASAERPSSAINEPDSLDGLPEMESEPEPHRQTEAEQAPAIVDTQIDARTGACTTAVSQSDDEAAPPYTPRWWLQTCYQLAIDGRVLNIASNLELVEKQGRQLLFRLDKMQSALYDDNHQQVLAAALNDYPGLNDAEHVVSKDLQRSTQPLSVVIEIAPVLAETPLLYRLRKQAERQAEAVRTFRDDPLVKAIEERFGGKVLEDTVIPLD